MRLKHLRHHHQRHRLTLLNYCDPRRYCLVMGLLMGCFQIRRLHQQYAHPHHRQNHQNRQHHHHRSRLPHHNPRQWKLRLKIQN